MTPAAWILLTVLGLHLPSVGAAVRSAGPDSAALKEGAPFVQTRSRLLALGWTPVRMHRDDSYEYSGTEKRLIERKFHEVDSCSTDRGSLCIHYYTKKGACLRVDTVGEQVNLMRVTRWENACPDGLGMGPGL